MAIVQKLKIDYKNSNQFEIIVRDETGTYSPSNPNGYGGSNGSPISQFSRYIFDIYNTNTGQSYRQIQSDNIGTNGEFNNPSIARIANKEDVYLNSDNFDINTFSDGVYKINMNLELSTIYYGDGFENQEIVVNVQGAESLYENYDGIIVGNDIYYIRGLEQSILILDRPITSLFTSFKPILKTSETLILYKGLNDCINKKIAQTLGECDCDNISDLNAISELQLLDWGIKRSIEIDDYTQAKSYLDLLMRVCSSLNCSC